MNRCPHCNCVIPLSLPCFIDHEEGIEYCSRDCFDKQNGKRECYICKKKFVGDHSVEEAFELFKEANGYMPNENQYVEICNECGKEKEDAEGS